MAHTVLILIVLLNVFCKEVHGNLSFASYFHDHMVLQRGPKRAIIWGYADTIGANVTARKNGTEVGTGVVKHGVGGRGVWKIKLPAETNPGPFTITITSRDQSASLSDVMFGDVWICSGQSNMQYSLNAVYTAAQELASAEEFQDIRTLFVELKEANTEQDDIIAIKTNWARPKRGVIDMFSAVCWLYAKNLYPHLKHPIGLIESNWGGTPIETWSSPDAMAKCTNHPRSAASWPTTPSVLWNAMIHPLLKMTIYGAIWYQGESNSDAYAVNYACQFPVMITDWRQKFHNASDGETDSMFPFGFVQLAPWRENEASLGFPIVRWAQTAGYGFAPNPTIPKTFMAVAVDLPDFYAPQGSIHPRFKEDIAYRLSLAGRAVAYSEQGLDYQGPYPSAFHLDERSHTLIIEFSYGTVPIEVRSNDGFELCCSSDARSQCSAPNDNWITVVISSHTDSSITIHTTPCKTHVAGVRYLWKESPCPLKKCAIYGRDNDLPTPPFWRAGGLQ